MTQGSTCVRPAVGATVWLQSFMCTKCQPTLLKGWSYLESALGWCWCSLHALFTPSFRTKSQKQTRQTTRRGSALKSKYGVNSSRLFIQTFCQNLQAFFFFLRVVFFYSSPWQQVMRYLNFLMNSRPKKNLIFGLWHFWTAQFSNSGRNCSSSMATQGTVPHRGASNRHSGPLWDEVYKEHKKVPTFWVSSLCTSMAWWKVPSHCKERPKFNPSSAHLSLQKLYRLHEHWLACDFTHLITKTDPCLTPLQFIFLFNS